MSKQEAEAIVLTPEEINQLSKALAEALTKQITENPEAIQSLFLVSVSGKTIITEDEITHVVRLDLMASSTAGVLDPLGQLQDWFKDIINSVSSWIVSGIETFINDYVLPAFNSLYSSVSGYINTYVIPLFDSLYSSITSFISDTLIPAINALPSTITDFLNTNVLPAINGVISTLSSTIGDLLNGAISTITDFINSAIATIPELVSSVISGIIDTINSVFASISSAIDAVVSTLSDIISGIVSSISDIVNSVASMIIDTIGGIVNTLSNIINSVSSAILDAISAIPSLISSLGETISGLISGIVTTITDVLNTVSQAIISSISATIQALSDAFNTIFESIMGAISGIVTTVTDLFSSLSQTILNIISSAIQTLSDVIGSITEVISSAISGVIETLTSILSSFASSILDAISSIAQTLGATISSFIDTIINAISGITSVILDALGSAIESISSIISGIVETIISTLSSIASSIIDVVSASINAISETIGNILQMITSGFATLGAGITDLFNIVVSSFQDMANMVSTGFQAISQTFMGFVNAILRLPEMLASAFQQIGAWIWNALPDWLSAVSSVVQGIQAFISDPFGWIQSYIIQPIVEFGETLFSHLVNIGQMIWNGLNWLWERIVEIGQTIAQAIWNALKGFAEWVCNSIVGFFKTIGSTLYNALVTAITEVGKTIVSGFKQLFSGIFTIGRDVAGTIGSIIKDMALWVFEPMLTTFTKAFKKQSIELTKTLETHSPPIEDIGYVLEALGLLISEVVGSHYLGWGLSQVLHAFASFCDELRPISKAELEGEGGCAVEPIGLGARLRSLLGWALSLGWHIKPSYIFRELAKDVRESTDEFFRGLIYGITIWATQPIVRMLNIAFRDLLVIELPSIPTMQEVVRRHMPRKDFENVLKKYVAMLKLYGYRTEVVDWLTNKEINIEIKDRFGTQRTIPLSLIYELPSASDVAKMMVRDLFASIEDFQKLYLARGMTPDIGALYYFLRFRYPPPERLWEFTTRGISGLLWVTLPDEERKEIEKEIKPIGAKMPKPPVSLNFKAGTLFSAFKTYMKWHDYFRGSWLPDFTSDNLLYIDTLADIPTKIDQRWMVKWGIYELLRDKKVTLESPIHDFVNKVIEQNPASEIQMDLTNFSRTLQATGIHPYWIPVTIRRKNIHENWSNEPI